MELLEVQKEADGASRKAIAFGLVALVLAAAFGWLVAHIGAGGPESQPVVVAKGPIDALVPLRAENLRTIDWPIAAVPEGVFSNITDVVGDKADEGKRIYITGLVTNEPIFKSKLSDPSRGLGVSQFVEPNMRAFVVQVEEAAGRAQIVHPGAMVDVIASVSDPRTRQVSTRVILQNIKVIAVGDRIDIPRVPTEGEKSAFDHALAEGRRVVTLLVSLPEAEVLALASGTGRLDLALRTDADTERVKTPGVDLSHVLGIAIKADSAGPEAGGSPPPQDDIVAPAEAARPKQKAPHARQPSGPGAGGPIIYKVRR